ncbi:MAG: nucleoside monophosphate kinase [Pseudomonadota bacterium]
MNIVLAGAPGSGKGVQAKLISKKYGSFQLSTGELFRKIGRESDDPLARKIKELIDRGEFVPDDITCEFVVRELKTNKFKNGFIMDGFPRNLNQAKIFDEILAGSKKKIDFVFRIVASDELVIKRLSGRRSCEKCNADYNIYFKNTNFEDKCDKCSGKLTKREDDHEDVIKGRLNIYHTIDLELTKYYEKKALLININGEKEASAVFSDIVAKIEKSND